MATRSLPAKNVVISFKCWRCDQTTTTFFDSKEHLCGNEVTEDYARDIEEVYLEYSCFTCETINSIKVFPLF
jgi:hypothetical protein